MGGAGLAADVGGDDVEGVAGRVHQLVDLLVGDHERGREGDGVAANAGEDTALLERR